MSGTFTLVAIFLVSLMSCCGSAAQSADSPRRFKVDFVFGAELAGGGDKLAEYATVVRIEGGPPFQSSSSLRAGTAGHLFLGLAFSRSDIPLKLQATWGKSMNRTADIDDLDSTFSRYPVEILPYLYYEKVRMGIGFAYHIGPTFKEDLYDETYRFDNASGYFIDVGYIQNKNITISGRMTILNYYRDGSRTPLDGDCVGVVFTFSS